MVDYYQILQVDSSANEQEIKRAFRLLAKKYHPDINRHTDAPEKFKLVYMAYEVLSNDFKKRLYDELRLEQETYSTYKANAGFNYDAGFEEWEHRAKRRADHFSKMKYEQFEKEELRGFDFIYHQFALLLGILGLFFIGGGGLYFAKTIFVAVYHEKSPPTSLIGAIISAAFGLIILWYVTKMVGAFKNTFLARFKKSS